MIKSQKIDYKDEETKLVGFYANDDAVSGKRPAVLVFHDWSGLNKFAQEKAEKLAQLGYIGFAVDMYGEGKVAETKEEKMAMIKPFMQDRAKLQKRILSAFDAVKNIEQVDQNNVAAIGFCFGGLCALDLARSGADIKAAISFHGLLNEPEQVEKNSIKAMILVLHGFDDPMAGHDQLIAFGKEMTKAKVDWEVNIYGNAMHAFTNPQANDPGFGTVYNKKADSRSWAAMKQFLHEAFGK